MARDQLKNDILSGHGLPLLRLPTIGSGEEPRIQDEFDKAERYWARQASLTNRRQ
jgi:hypothetical protein